MHEASQIKNLTFAIRIVALQQQSLGPRSLAAALLLETVVELGSGDAQEARRARQVATGFAHRMLDQGFLEGVETYPGFDHPRAQVSEHDLGIGQAACGIDHVPPPLLQQLKAGGLMVIPVGPPGAQRVLKVTKTQGADGSITTTREDIYGGKIVPFVPFTKLEGDKIVGAHSR